MTRLSQVKQFAQNEMPNKPFHNFAHAERVADVASSMGSEPELLKAAAYMHDIGHRRGASGHEERSSNLAKQKLPQFGYAEEQAERIALAITDTELFKKPSTKVGTVLSDADTHNFGLKFERFKSLSLKVKREEDPSSSEDEWWKSVIGLLQNHTYHGPGANRYASQKEQNLEKLQEMIDN